MIKILKQLGYGEDEVADPLNVQRALSNNYSSGDKDKAIELLLEFRDAFIGKLQPVTHLVDDTPYYYKIVGTDNWNGVSCYLDSLLFAMFARMTNFEPILFKNFGDDELRGNLAMFIRLWVNMIRTGKLVTSDIVGGLMDALVAAGWKPSGGKNSQQDAGELFAFITEKLNMPLLTLKVDIAHGGKEDKKDDHKLINESLLHVPIPGSPSDPPILLEECLELYFSNSVQVSRQLERRKTLESITDIPRPTRGVSFQGSSAMRIERPRKFSLHLDRVDNLPTSADPSSTSVASSASSSAISLSSLSLNTNDSNRISSPLNSDISRPINSRFPGSSKVNDSPKSIRESPRRARANSRATVLSYDGSLNERAGSSISTEPIDRSLKATRSQDSDDSGVGSPPTYDSVYRDRSPPTQFAPMNGFEKYVIPGGSGASAGSNELWNNNMEITLPAWMFLQLLPFYTETGDKIDTSAHGTSSPVAQHFANARPVLGISLKRYAMTNSGDPVRNDRMVVVPKTIRLPSFVADDHSVVGDDAAFGNFKLELESAIFHRGVSLNSGHFVSLAAEDAFISYDENKEHLQSLTKKKSYTERLFGTRGILSSNKKDEQGSATTPSVEIGNVSPPSSALTSPQLRPSEPDVVRKAPKDKRWILLDDLQPPEKKVTIVDFDKIFKEEVPYMLFYRMVALDEEILEDLASGLTSVHSSGTPTIIASDQNLDPISPIQTIVSWPQTYSHNSHNREQSLGRPTSGGTSATKPEQELFKQGKRGNSPERRKRGRAKADNYREEKCLLM